MYESGEKQIHQLYSQQANFVVIFRDFLNYKFRGKISNVKKVGIIYFAIKFLNNQNLQL